MYAIFEKDFRWMYQELQEHGYHYACVLPIRTLRSKERIEELRKSNLAIVHIEGPRNPAKGSYNDFLPAAVVTGALGKLRRMLGDNSEPPILEDTLPFPSRATCDSLLRKLFEAFPGAKFVTYDVNVNFGLKPERLLLGIHPGLHMTASEILNWANGPTMRNGIGLVFDPHYLLPSDRVISMQGRPTRPGTGEWERQFRIFAGKTEVVDIHPRNRQDIQDLRKRRGMLTELAQAAREYPRIRYLRVELPIYPRWMTGVPRTGIYGQNIDLLKEIAEVLR